MRTPCSRSSAQGSSQPGSHCHSRRTPPAIRCRCRTQSRAAILSTFPPRSRRSQALRRSPTVLRGIHHRRIRRAPLRALLLRLPWARPLCSASPSRPHRQAADHRLPVPQRGRILPLICRGHRHRKRNSRSSGRIRCYNKPAALARRAHQGQGKPHRTQPTSRQERGCVRAGWTDFFGRFTATSRCSPSGRSKRRRPGARAVARAGPARRTTGSSSACSRRGPSSGPFPDGRSHGSVRGQVAAASGGGDGVPQLRPRRVPRRGLGETHVALHRGTKRTPNSPLPTLRTP